MALKVRSRRNVNGALIMLSGLVRQLSGNPSKFHSQFEAQMRNILVLGVSSFAWLALSSAADAQTCDPNVRAALCGAADLAAFETVSPALVAPSTASTGYDFVASTHTYTIDARISDLAEALDNDADRIFDYVYNAIDTTPSMGLTKGAYGAMMEGYGTPFDQADLMVQLLRSANSSYQANYVVGTIVLTGSEFADYFGPTTARGACQLLAGGGIPGAVNGSSTTNCSSFSASTSITQVEMLHAWVSATIDGQAYQFDPSLTSHIWHAPNASVLNSVSAIGSTGNGARSAANGSIDQLAGFNPSSLHSQFTSNVSGLRSALEAAEQSTEVAYASSSVPNQTVQTHQPLSMEAVVGGSEMVRVDRFSEHQAERNASHSDAGGSISAQVFSEIPDDMRTYLRFQLRGSLVPGTVQAISTGLIDATSIAGRRFMAIPDNIAFYTDDPTSFGFVLSVDEDVLVDLDGNEVRVTHDTGSVVSTGRGMPLRWAVDHPHLGDDAFDRVVDTFVSDAFPSAIVIGFGERTDRAEVINAGAISGSEDITWQGQVLPLHDEWGAPLTIEFGSNTWFQDGRYASVVQLAQSFLTDQSRFTNINAGLSHARAYAHHVSGVVGVRVTPTAIWQPETTTLYADMSASFSFAAMSSSASGRDAFALANGTALTALEQAGLRNSADAPSAHAVPAMFDWFFRSTRAEAYTPNTAAGNASLQIRALEADTSNLSGVESLLWQVEGNQTYADYVTGGFTVIMPQSGRLGPARNGRRVGSKAAQYPTMPNVDTCNDGHNLYNCWGRPIGYFDLPETIWQNRSGAYLAMRSDTSSIAVAPLIDAACQSLVALSQTSACQNNPMKGAGAEFASNIEAPVADREALSEAYETWATAFSVDGRTGGLTLTAPADLTIGAGYALAFQRTYSSDRGSDGPLGWGWTHNYDLGLNLGSDIGATLGDQTPHQALATIIVAHSVLEMFEGSTDLGRDLVQAQIAYSWWSDSVFDNQVSIRRSTASERFILQPDGVWEGPTGSTATLQQSGVRLAESDFNFTVLAVDPANADAYGVVSEAFDRRDITFTYTSPGGTVETYAYGVDPTNHGGDLNDAYGITDPGGRGCASAAANRWGCKGGSGRSYRIVSSDPIAGPTTSFVYGNPAGGSYARAANGVLQSVSVGAPFSWSLSFSYEVNPHRAIHAGQEGPRDFHDPGGVNHRLVSVSDGSRTVSFAYTSASLGGRTAGLERVDGVEAGTGDTVTYTWSAASNPTPPTLFPGGQTPSLVNVLTARPRLDGVRVPHEPNADFMSFNYDAEGLAQSVVERDGHTTRFFSAGGARSMTLDPWNVPSYAYYDRDGRTYASQTVRSTWNRNQDSVTRSRFDAWGRSIYSEIGFVANLSLVNTRDETFYDQYSNTVLSRSLGGTNSSGSPLTSTRLDQVTEYGYLPFPSLPTVQTDGRGNSSTTCYERTSVAPCNSSQIQDPSTPDGLPRAMYGPSGEETLIEYDSYGRITRERVRVAN